MKVKMLAGIVLIVAGLLGLIYGSIPYTKKKDVVQVGPMRAEVETQEEVPIPPIVGGLVLASGVALVLLARKSKS
ncbi:MAG: DUF3185 domain-containing protein [Candidatus Acidiferrales bacterium]